MNKNKKKILKEVVKRLNKDEELGRYFRHNYLNLYDVVMTQGDFIVHKFQNDKDLGNYLRNSYYHLVNPYV
jgi:hypothetical protein